MANWLGPLPSLRAAPPRVEFHDEGGGTRLVMRQGPFSEEMAGMAREGRESSFTKLDELLAA